MVNVLIMSGYGINCEEESAHAFEKAGAQADIVHINDLIAGKKKMSDYHIMMFPGGFSYGDDTGAGNAFARKVKNNLWSEVEQFIKDGKLILGVCNGFQIMSQLGLFSNGKPINALRANTQNRYECRWVSIKNNSTKCVFTKGVSVTQVPIAHGEGNFYADEQTMQELEANDQIVFTYTTPEGEAAQQQFPHNPNGSLKDIAGICDRTGRVMGMMPHPERAIYTVNLPDFHVRKDAARRKKETLPEEVAANLLIFKNAVTFCQEQFGQ